MCNVHPTNILQQLYSTLTRPCFICVFAFLAKIQNGHHFWGEEIFFKKLARVDYLDTPGVETFDEIPLSSMVKEIEANLCFSIFGENSKIQNDRHF